MEGSDRVGAVAFVGVGREGDLLRQGAIILHALLVEGRGRLGSEGMSSSA